MIFRVAILNVMEISMNKWIFAIALMIAVAINALLIDVVFALHPDTDLSTADISFIGENSGDQAGCSVSSAGDLNADGFDDFVIGAKGYDYNGHRAGKTYILFGSGSLNWGMEYNLGSASASFIGEESEDRCGRYISRAGDVNGDDYDDIIIGTSEKPYLVFGKASGWTMDSSLSEADVIFDRGKKASCAGDVNGDGYDDLLIASTDETYLVFGKSSDWDNVYYLATADASFEGEGEGDPKGIGDVNGDGYDDFVIGAEGNDDLGFSAGQTYLILGRASGWSTNIDLSTADASFWGETLGDQAGCSVSGAGDLNGDGYDDFLIGTYDTGTMYIILGKASGWDNDTILSNADASFVGENFIEMSISAAGDVNSDGYDDFLVGNGRAGNPGGITYLILGKASGWAMDTPLTNADASFLGEDSGDGSGWSVSGAGDINGDGNDDFLIGAPSDEEGGMGAALT